MLCINFESTLLFGARLDHPTYLKDKDKNVFPLCFPLKTKGLLERLNVSFACP